MLVLLGAACVAAGLWAARGCCVAMGCWPGRCSGRPGRRELALRVAHLAQTRADTIDAGAAEMRRIERDLHDGAQARLVAMGMTLDAADQMLEERPGSGSGAAGRGPRLFREGAG